MLKKGVPMDPQNGLDPVWGANPTRAVPCCAPHMVPLGFQSLEEVMELFHLNQDINSTDIIAGSIVSLWKSIEDTQGKSESDREDTL